MRETVRVLAYACALMAAYFIVAIVIATVTQR